MLCTCLCTNYKEHDRSWDMWLTKYISTNLRSSKYEIRIIKFHIYLHMCGHGFVVHHLETLQALLLHIFLNWGKYLSGDCHTTNHKNHNNILEYSSQLPSEYEHHTYLLFFRRYINQLHWFFMSYRLATPSHHMNVRIIIWVLHHGDLWSYIYMNLLFETWI